MGFLASEFFQPSLPSHRKFWEAVFLVVMVGVYYVTSAASGIYNKQLVSSASSTTVSARVTQGEREAAAGGGGVSPSVLTFLHLLVSIASDAAIYKSQQGEKGTSSSSEGASASSTSSHRSYSSSSGSSPSGWHILRAFAPVSVFVILGKLTTYVAYQYTSISAAHIAKASEPIFNVIVASAFFGEREPPAVIACLLPIAVGVASASFTEQGYSHMGFLCSCASALMKVFQNIYTKLLFKQGHFSFWEIHLYCGVCSLAMLLPVLLLEGIGGASNPFAVFPVVSLILCSALQYVSSVASYKVLHLCSHLTFTVLNVLKRLFIIVAGLLFYRQGVTPLNILGVTLAMLGILCYNLARDLPPSLAAGPPQLLSWSSWRAWIGAVLWKVNHLQQQQQGGELEQDSTELELGVGDSKKEGGGSSSGSGGGTGSSSSSSSRTGSSVGSSNAVSKGSSSSTGISGSGGSSGSTGPLQRPVPASLAALSSTSNTAGGEAGGMTTTAAAAASMVGLHQQDKGGLSSSPPGVVVSMRFSQQQQQQQYYQQPLHYLHVPSPPSVGGSSLGTLGTSSSYMGKAVASGSAATTTGAGATVLGPAA